MRRIFVAENDSGEWGVADLVLDYRVCAFNRDQHGGAHIHHPLDGPAGGPAHLDSAAQAKAVVAAYGRHHTQFDIHAFREEVIRWKSESKSD